MQKTLNFFEAIFSATALVFSFNVLISVFYKIFWHYIMSQQKDFDFKFLHIFNCIVLIA